MIANDTVGACCLVRQISAGLVVAIAIDFVDSFILGTAAASGGDDSFLVTSSGLTVTAVESLLVTGFNDLLVALDCFVISSFLTVAVLCENSCLLVRSVL